MSEKEEVEGKFRYEQDSKRYHRFQIEQKTVNSIGMIYCDMEAVQIQYKHPD